MFIVMPVQLINNSLHLFSISEYSNLSNQSLVRGRYKNNLESKI